jgi:hypothetical protein
MGSHFGTTLSFSQLDGVFFTSYRSNTSATVCAFAKHDVNQFENEVCPVLSLPDFDTSLTTYIRDGMALVQCMDAKKHITFGDLATDYGRQLTSCFAKAHTVADVFRQRKNRGNFIFELLH